MFDTSRSRIQKAAEAKAIHVNGNPVKSNYKVKAGDTVEVVLNEPPRDSTIVPQELDLDILHRDEHVIVINKQPGLVCQISAWQLRGNPRSWPRIHLAENLPVGKQGEERPAWVHRLDKNTSGGWLQLCQELGMAHLAKQFFDRTTLARICSPSLGKCRRGRGYY